MKMLIKSKIKIRIFNSYISGILIIKITLKFIHPSSTFEVKFENKLCLWGQMINFEFNRSGIIK